MGKHLLDAYSLLHFATGVVAQHWAVPFWIWMLVHTVFEWAENTKTGMSYINRYVSAWPGGKPAADSFLNNVGDTIAAAVGWLVSAWLLDLEQNPRPQ
jgi:hypothetical protein